MNRSGILWRMALLVAVFLAALFYILVDVIGVNPGAQPFTVAVELPTGGGLYPGSYVTYRGVDVGRVANLALRRTDVVATLSVNAGTRVPTDVTASVRDLSAVGEQYIDLVPPPGTTGHHLLHSGSVIPPSQVRTPVSIGKVLQDLGSLAAGISPTDVNAIATALGSGFTGSGQDLRNITVTGQQLITALAAAEPATLTLIAQAAPLLRTVIGTNSNLSSFASGIDQLTAQLQASDGNLSALFTNGAAFAEDLNPLLQQDGAAVTSLLQSGAILANTTAAAQPAVQAFMQAIPAFAGAVAHVASGGAVGVEIRYNTQEPVCPYISGSQTTEPTQPTGAAALGRSCQSAAPGLLVRGANNAPHP